MVDLFFWLRFSALSLQPDLEVLCLFLRSIVIASGFSTVVFPGFECGRHGTREKKKRSPAQQHTTHTAGRKVKGFDFSCHCLSPLCVFAQWTFLRFFRSVGVCCQKKKADESADCSPELSAKSCTLFGLVPGCPLPSPHQGGGIERVRLFWQWSSRDPHLFPHFRSPNAGRT